MRKKLQYSLLVLILPIIASATAVTSAQFNQAFSKMSQVVTLAPWEVDATITFENQQSDQLTIDDFKPGQKLDKVIHLKNDNNFPTKFLITVKPVVSADQQLFLNPALTTQFMPIGAETQTKTVEHQVEPINASGVQVNHYEVVLEAKQEAWYVHQLEWLESEQSSQYAGTTGQLVFEITAQQMEGE